MTRNPSQIAVVLAVVLIATSQVVSAGWLRLPKLPVPTLPIPKPPVPKPPVPKAPVPKAPVPKPPTPKDLPGGTANVAGDLQKMDAIAPVSAIEKPGGALEHFGKAAGHAGKNLDETTRHMREELGNIITLDEMKRQNVCSTWWLPMGSNSMSFSEEYTI